MQATLTFKNGKFILENGTFEVIKKLFRSALNDKWMKINPDDYSTTHLGAAAEFRSYADEEAKNILKRYLFKQYHPTERQLPFDFSDVLDPHQIEGLHWILSRNHSYLAHAPGAGKTAQAIIASVLCGKVVNSEKQVLFIVPPDLTVNWEREILKWIGLVSSSWHSIFIVPESARKHNCDWRAEFIICPDSMIGKEWVYRNLRKRKFRFVGVDEASRFKEAESLRTKVLFGGVYGKNSHRFAGLAYDAAHTVLLDGSPMPNRSMELFAPLSALAPHTIEYMNQSEFGFKYCGATINDRGCWEFKYSSNETELNVNITKDFMHVVTEDKLNHPERLRKMIFMTKDPRTPEMKTWEKKHLTSNGDFIISEKDNSGELASHRQQLGINKIDWIVRYVERKLSDNPNEAILLFAWHRDVVLGLQQALVKYKPGVIMGGVDKSEREKIQANFQSGKTRIIIANILAMGRGHNLQRASRIVFREFAWSDETNKQAEKRASRKGSERMTIPCDYIVAGGSLDERVLSSLFTKEKRVKRVIG